MRRHVMVTGASSGIGLAICKRLREKGNEVLGISRTSDFPCDLSDLDLLPKKVEEMVMAFPEVDVVVCNAGKGHFGNLEEFSNKKIRELIDLNFTSQALLVRSLLPILKKRERADIIFMGSEAALKGRRKGAIYCASKFALRGFAQALREECASSGVRVSLIQPGAVRTGFHDGMDFRPGDQELEALLAEDIADGVEMILDLPPRAVCEELVLSPMKRVIQFTKKEVASSVNDLF